MNYVINHYNYSKKVFIFRVDIGSFTDDWKYDFLSDYFSAKWNISWHIENSGYHYL